ncbi:MAG: hypothetical protein RLZZ435_2437 [Cyanobacteriota bacterium]|jgi:hypothetical protein
MLTTIAKTNTTTTTTKCSYTLEMVREEARHLVARGDVNRQQPIYVLCQYIPAREWDQVELELECGGFLLRDRMVDLLGREDWSND